MKTYTFYEIIFIITSHIKFFKLLILVRVLHLTIIFIAYFNLVPYLAISQIIKNIVKNYSTKL